MGRKHRRAEKLYSIDEIVKLIRKSYSFNRKCVGFKWLDHVESLPKTIEIDGYFINISSNRLKTFADKGTVCACCGIAGSYFVIEYHKRDPTKSYNLALYAELDGKEILMTSDHIIPVSLGGSGSMFNRQTLCKPCNSFKSNKIVSNYVLLKNIQKKKRRRQI